MNINWIVPSVGVVVAIALLVASRLRRDHDVDLGTVSHQWMAEQRLGQGHDRQR